MKEGRKGNEQDRETYPLHGYCNHCRGVSTESVGAMELRHRFGGSLHQRPQAAAQPVAGPLHLGIEQPTPARIQQRGGGGLQGTERGFGQVHKAFDVIDILYQSLRTSLNVYSTYNSVSDRVGDYKDLLDDYYTKVVERNRMELMDTLIIGISLRCVQRIAEDGKQLYRSMSDLVLYATGAAACSTSDLLLVLESINQGLDNIERHLNKAYFETWRYIQLRMGYWKESIYIAKDKSQIANEAFRRWRDSGLNPYNR